MKNILFLLLAFLLITGCKKEVRIERNLYSNGGKWAIVKYEHIVTSTWPANEENEVIENYGIIQFQKNGRGWIIESDGLGAYKIAFSYTNTDSKLTLNYDGGYDPEIYDLEWKKNSFTLTQKQTSSYTPDPYDDTFVVTDNYLYRMTCEKE